MSFNSKSDYIKDVELFKMSNSISFDLGAWVFLISTLKRAQNLRSSGGCFNLKSSKARSASQKTVISVLPLKQKIAFKN